MSAEDYAPQSQCHEHAEIVSLSPADQQCFAEAILSPPSPSAALKRAMDRRRELTRCATSPAVQGGEGCPDAKVEAARASMRAGHGKPNDEVEAAFAAKRDQV